MEAAEESIQLILMLPVMVDLFCFVPVRAGLADHDLTETGRGYTDFLLLKIDSKGELLWQKRYGGDLQDSAKSFIPTLDGGYLMVGYSYSGVSGEVTHGKKGGSDMWIIKTDANGSKVWDQRFGGSRDDRCFDLHQKPNGNYVLLDNPNLVPMEIKQPPI